jgi:nicotinamide mononucleotide transporter
MSAVEIVAALFGLACVGLTIRRNIWCWPTGLVQVALYVWVFYKAKLYADVGLQVVYVALQIYGWHYWLHGGRVESEPPIARLGRAGLAGWVAVAAAGALAVGWAMARFTDASLPYWDAAIVALSLVAQFLLSRKVLENWLFWIVVDVLAVGVYLAKDLYATTVLYAVFLVMAVLGWFAWRSTCRKQIAMTSTAAAPLPAPAAGAVSSSASSCPLTAGTSSSSSSPAITSST